MLIFLKEAQTQTIIIGPRDRDNCQERFPQTQLSKILFNRDMTQI